jgi:hypothetical protein
METIIKKGTSKSKIKILLNQKKKRRISKKPDLQKYCGILNLNEDALILQKKWRNEWK